MAFVQEIEADKISDFNILQAFVRVPLFILGGVLGGSNRISDLDDVDDDMLDPAVATTSRMSSSEVTYIDCSSSSTTALDFGDGSTANRQQPLCPHEVSPSCRIISDNEIDDTDGLKRSKKMSWSDSVGLRLVEYNDETLPHEPGNAPHRPSKSAMKKCLSERDPEVSTASTSSKRYIPKMGGAALNMPSFSNNEGSPALSNGYVSPEWGWYINTTPPTPEMYHSSSSISATKQSKTDAVGAPIFPFASQSDAQHLVPQTASNISGNASGIVRRHKNHIFQNLQSTVTPNMGWTSVPI